jgi:hypothetical protein
MSDELSDKAITLEIRKNNEGKTIINNVRADGLK